MESFGYKDILRKLIIIVVVTIAIYSLIVYTGSLKVEDFYDISFVIVLSSIPAIITFILKGIRFYLIVKRLLPKVNISLVKGIWVRIASEIFSFIGVSYIGDEAFRIYYLNRCGAEVWESIWASYLELGEEVLAASTIVIIGSIYYFLKGIHPTSIVIGALASLVIIVVNLIFVLGSNKIISLFDKLLMILIGRFSTPLYHRLRERIFSNIEKGYAIRKLIITDKTLLFATIIVSYLITLSSGLTLYVLLIYFNIQSDVFFSTYIVYLILAVSSLPITIGGLGISEAYILYVGSEFSGMIPWLLPIAYRFSSYFIPLVLCLILFILLMRREDRYG